MVKLQGLSNKHAMDCCCAADLPAASSTVSFSSPAQGRCPRLPAACGTAELPVIPVKEYNSNCDINTSGYCAIVALQSSR